MNKGFTCYIDYEVSLGSGKRKRLEVDVFAKKNQELILVEVGTLSYMQHGLNSPKDRLKLLKQIMPTAKVIHITQWKNFLNSYDWQKQNEFYVGQADVQRMGESMATKS